MDFITIRSLVVAIHLTVSQCTVLMTLQVSMVDLPQYGLHLISHSKMVCSLPAVDYSMSNLSYVLINWLINMGHRWVCAVGSPCEKVTPSTAFGSPEIYFAIKVTTVDDSSYCVYNTVLYLRLHGIPMDAVTSVITLLVTFSVMVIVLGIGFTIYHYKATGYWPLSSGEHWI